MKDPYEVLGIARNASDDEVKSAYKALVKKYHPDKYQNNPLADLAEEKLQEINEAYDAITKEREAGSSQGYSYGQNSYSSNPYNANNSGYSSGYQNASPEFQQIRMALDRGELQRAEQLLLNIRNHNGEWFFLSGILSYKKGWIDDGLANVREAMKLSPANEEYARVYQQMIAGSSMYANRSNNQGYRQSNDCCSDCCTLYCLTSWCSPCW